MFFLPPGLREIMISTLTLSTKKNPSVKAKFCRNAITSSCIMQTYWKFQLLSTTCVLHFMSWSMKYKTGTGGSKKLSLATNILALKSTYFPPHKTLSTGQTVKVLICHLSRSFILLHHCSNV